MLTIVIVTSFALGTVFAVIAAFGMAFAFCSFLLRITRLDKVVWAALERLLFNIVFVYKSLSPGGDQELPLQIRLSSTAFMTYGLYLLVGYIIAGIQTTLTTSFWVLRHGYKGFIWHHLVSAVFIMLGVFVVPLLVKRMFIGWLLAMIMLPILGIASALKLSVSPYSYQQGMGQFGVGIWITCLSLSVIGAGYLWSRRRQICVGTDFDEDRLEIERGSISIPEETRQLIARAGLFVIVIHALISIVDTLGFLRF